MNGTRFAAVIAGTAGMLAIGLIGALSVMVLANGVLSTSANAWTTELTVGRRSVTVNIPGLVRLATAPGMAYLADGHTLATPVGRIELRRVNGALIARCAPCRLQHSSLASTPLVLPSAELGVERTGAIVRGWLLVDGMRLDFLAQLAADGVRLRWRLPPTEIARAYHAIAGIVPEARWARIEGTFEAHGQFELPRRTGSLQFTIDQFEVGGLGTEALQSGWFAMSCRRSDGAERRIVTGESEARWVPLDRMGSLPAAIIAAEDQRFHGHAGYDQPQVASLLAEVDVTGPKRGASTLTQQLARTLFTGGEKTAARKLRELLYAIEMERTLGKARILELYLNTVDWGPGLCGARAAARTYFRKRPDQLTPLEAAWLASILRAPHVAHEQQFLAGRPDAERARWVMMQMRELPKPERARWTRMPLVFAATPAARTGERSAHRDAHRNAPVAKTAVEATEATDDRDRAVRTASALR